MHAIILKIVEDSKRLTPCNRSEDANEACTSTHRSNLIQNQDLHEKMFMLNFHKTGTPKTLPRHIFIHKPSLPMEVSHLSYGQVLHFGTSHEKQSSFITFAYCGIEGRQTLISEKNNMQQISFVFHPENTNLTMTCLQYFTFFCL